MTEHQFALVMLAVWSCGLMNIVITAVWAARILKVIEKLKR
jgi:hypothetical protein